MYEVVILYWVSVDNFFFSNASYSKYFTIQRLDYCTTDVDDCWFYNNRIDCNTNSREIDFFLFYNLF